MENYDHMLTKKGIPGLLKAFGLSILIFAIGGGLSFLVPKSAQTVTAILSITTLGLLASLLKSVNQIKKSFQLGMYFIIVFSLVVSSMANLTGMFQIDFLELFLFVLLVVFGSMIIHVGLSKIFGIDADTHHHNCNYGTHLFAAVCTSSCQRTQKQRGNYFWPYHWYFRIRFWYLPRNYSCHHTWLIGKLNLRKKNEKSCRKRTSSNSFRCSAQNVILTKAEICRSAAIGSCVLILLDLI